MSNMSYDWSVIENVAATLKSSLSTFDQQLSVIDSTVAKMGNSWAGASYEAFRAYYDNYKSGTIEPLSTEIKNWVSKLEQLAESAKTTQNNNEGLFSNN